MNGNESRQSLNVRIDYYKVTAKGGDDGRFGGMLTCINQNVNERERETLMKTQNYNLTIQEGVGDKYLVCCVRSLRGDAPSKGQKWTNQTEPIALKANEGISEQTLCVYDPKTSVMAVQYNYHGPKIGDLFRLAKAINNEFELGVHIDGLGYMPFILGSQIDLAMSSHTVSAIEAKSRFPVQEGILRPDDNFPDMCLAYEMPRETSVEIKIKQKGGSLNGILRRSFLRKVEDISRFSKLKVTLRNPETNEPEECDLIKNVLRSKVQIDKIPGTKEFDKDVLQGLIINDYESMRKRYRF